MHIKKELHSRLLRNYNNQQTTGKEGRAAEATFGNSGAAAFRVGDCRTTLDKNGSFNLFL